MWPRDIIEPVVISAGLPLVLSCDPPPGPPKPETYWMSSCECVLQTEEREVADSRRDKHTFVLPAGSFARPFNWPIQTAFPTMQPVPQDRRVSMGVNGDLYFSNVLVNDSVADYCCNARFPYRNVIQQKRPVVVKVLTSGCGCVRCPQAFHLPFHSPLPPAALPKNRRSCPLFPAFLTA